MHIPNQTSFTLSDIENIVSQIQQTFILVGDFNRHITTWGSYKTDPRRKIIEELILQDNLILINTGLPTKINSSNENLSSFDLRFFSIYLAHKLDWQVLPDIYSSIYCMYMYIFFLSQYPPLDKSLLFY